VNVLPRPTVRTGAVALVHAFVGYASIGLANTIG